jgi:PqqD family protein of HPr-rel-A system
MWRLTPGQMLRSREWQGEHVLYNDLSGDTHVLGDSAVWLLHALRERPAVIAALTAAMRAEFELEAGEVGEADIAALLDELEALALVEAAA